MTHRTLTGWILGLTTAVLAIGAIASSTVYAATTKVDLASAGPFAILSGTPNITDAGNTSKITGNIGLYPGPAAGVEIGCAQITGTIYLRNTATPPPCAIVNEGLLNTAKIDLGNAYDDAAGRTPTANVSTELGGTRVTAGVYAANTLEITGGAGALVLDGQNDPSSVFIFKAAASGTGLTVGPASTVSLINGAQACNVFWQLDSATIDTTATFKGTILALTSITVENGANIEGRLLARNGNVTLINDTITVPMCATGTGEGSTDTPTPPTGNNTVTPGFPNSGQANENILNWAIAASTFVVAGTVAAYFIRKNV